MAREKNISPLLVVVLALAFVVRLWGIWYGLPHPFIGDEPAMIAGAMKMLQLKTLLPALHPVEFRLLYYPPLVPYLLLVPLSLVLPFAYLSSGLSNVTAFVQSIILDPTIVWLVARSVAATLGTVTVYVVYRLATTLFDGQTGRVAAMLLATSFLHVQLSHFIRHWVPAALAVTVVAYFAVRIAHGGTRRDYLWAGVAAGFGFGVSYIPVLAILLVVIAHWYNPTAIKPKIVHSWVWLSLALAAGISVLFIVLHPQEFWRIALGEDSTATGTKSALGLLASYRFHAMNFLYLEPVLFVLTVVGALGLWAKSRKTLVLLFALPVTYFTVLYFTFHDEVRYLLLALPLLCVAAAYPLAGLFRRAAQFSMVSAAALLVLVFALPLAVDGKYLQLLSAPDNRELALAWMAENIPAGTRVVTDVVTFQLTPTKDSLVQQRELDASSLRIEDRTLLEVDDERYPTPAYEVLPLHVLNPGVAADVSPATLQRAGFQFLIVEDAPTVSLAATGLIAGGARVIQKFPSELPDLNGNYRQSIFTIFPARRLGPTVTIYQLPPL